jgi:hypothetical protein
MWLEDYTLINSKLDTFTICDDIELKVLYIKDEHS